MTNIMLAFVLANGLFILSNQGAAQSKDIFHDKLSEQHTKIQEQTTVIEHGLSRTQAEHKRVAEAIGKQLDTANTIHQELKENISRKHRDKVKTNHTAIDKHHSDALKEFSQLNDELSKQKHNELKVRHHATRIHHSIEKAEKENTISRKKTAKQAS